MLASSGSLVFHYDFFVIGGLGQGKFDILVDIKYYLILKSQ